MDLLCIQPITKKRIFKMSASFFTILGCKTLQALSFCVKIEVTEIEKEEAYEISRAQ
jgi:hypothetical protein